MEISQPPSHGLFSESTEILKLILVPRPLTLFNRDHNLILSAFPVYNYHYVPEIQNVADT